MTTLYFHIPAPISEPRGASIAVAAVLATHRAWVRLLARVSHRRDISRRSAEAAEVRAMAREMEQQDPRVAAELFAAADRHELG